MFNPRGKVVLTMRLTDTTVDADGTETTLRLSAGGVVVIVRPDSLSRRKFAQFCERHGLIAHAAERAGGADGSYNRRTGVVQTAGRDEPRDYRQDPTVTAWQVMGDGAALSALVGMDESGRRGDPKPFVQSWHFALNVRAPMAAQGSGPEKVRSPMESAFGKPATTAATADALKRQRDQRLAAEVKAGRI